MLIAGSSKDYKSSSRHTLHKILDVYFCNNMNNGCKLTDS